MRALEWRSVRSGSVGAAPILMYFISRESHVGAEHENSETFALSTASLLRRAASAGSGDDRAFRGRRDG